MQQTIFSFLVGAGLILGSCSTLEAMQRKPKQLSAVSSQTTEPVILELVIGEHNSMDMPAEHCGLGLAELEDASKIHSLIAEASKEEIQVALHFRATDPSYGYYALAEGERLVLRESHSSTHFRDGPASKQLIELIDSHCKRDD